MKHSFFGKVVVLLTLYVLLIFSTSGTALAQSIKTTKSLTASSSQSCGWVNENEFTQLIPQGSTWARLTFTLWDYTCNQGYHCEISSPATDGYTGAVHVSIYGNGTFLETIYGGVSPGGFINTDTYHNYDFSCGGGPN